MNNHRLTYEAPAIEVVELAMEAGMMQASPQNFGDATRQSYDSYSYEEWN